MAFADASGTRLAYVSETTEGTTPASPGFQNLRFTSENIVGEKQTVSSNEIREDGNVPDVTKVGQMVSGGFDFELTYSTFDDLLESALLGTWASDQLANARDRHSFTIEKTFETGATDVYSRYLGCMINTTTFNFRAKEIVTGNMTLMGRSYDRGSADLSGATYTSANTNSVMNCSSDFAALQIGGASPTIRVRSITLNLNNNLRAQDEVGSSALAGIGLGRHVVTGSLEAYLENTDVLDLLDDHTQSNLIFTVGSTSTEKYTFELPKLYMTAGDAATPGNDQDVMVNMDFQAVYDNTGSPTNDHTIKITRAVA